MIQLLLADKHQLLHSGIRTILSTIDGFDFIGAVVCETELQLLLCKFKPDILLLSLNIIAPPYEDIFHRIKEQCPATKTLVLLHHTNEICLQQLIKLDLDGAILKSDAPDKLLEAIQVIRTEQKWFSSELLTQLFRPPYDDQRNELTNREIEVLLSIASEKTDGEIAIMLGIMERTVRYHIDNSKNKLGTTTRIGTVIEAIRRNIIQ